MGAAGWRDVSDSTFSPTEDSSSRAWLALRFPLGLGLPWAAEGVVNCTLRWSSAQSVASTPPLLDAAAVAAIEACRQGSGRCPLRFCSGYAPGSAEGG